jgi:hypothetical protein
MTAKLVLEGREGCNCSRYILGEESPLMLCKQVLKFGMFGENG